MSAERAPQRSPRERAELFVAEHQQRYTDALSRVREAASTTQTAAWQANYETQTAMHRNGVTSATKAIEEAAKRIAMNDTTEDDEKLIKDQVKFLAEERASFDAWMSRCVGPFRESVTRMNEIASTAKREAEMAQADSPLINANLAEEVAAIVKGWPTARWDEKHGQVIVES